MKNRQTVQHILKYINFENIFLFSRIGFNKNIFYTKLTCLLSKIIRMKKYVLVYT